jgi:uncharacterized protein YbjT (DUF2867 family)
MNTRTALLIGATGLVGRHCLERLLADPDYEAVTVLGRRRPAVDHPKLHAHIVDFAVPEPWRDLARGHDLFSCLGTTRAQAGSPEAFRQVDFTYQRTVAEAARRNGTRLVLLVSALGASRRAPAFYSRVKGEIEDALIDLAFDATHIFRPSLLVGQRDHVRPAEHVGLVVGRVLGLALVGPLRRYRPIDASRVAACMVATAARDLTGVRVYESEQIATCAS